jgi:serine/threonine-protein kinase HipA
MSNILRIAKVYFKDEFAGRLEETAAGGTRFVYHEAWSKNIACCLPVSRREHEWKQGLHPLFQNLGAEGWLRERQARESHLSENDDLGLLLLHGADCIGAVSILPETSSAPIAPANYETPTSPGRTLSGVQRKLLVIHDETINVYRPAGPTGPAPYIAKFNSNDLPDLVRNEFLTLRWTAAVLGADEVTGFKLDRVAELDEQALIVTRFDRTSDGQKLRAEDFAQILCKPRGQGDDGKYKSSYEEVAEIIKANSARPEIDLAKLFRRLIIFTIVANSDAHLKNFTLLERPEGLRLSPLYDVVNVGLYGKRYGQVLALEIDGKKRELENVTRPLLTDFGRKIGLSTATITNTFTELKTKIQHADKLLEIPSGEGPEGFYSSFSEIVWNGCLRIWEE